jgi:hypothetical protein
MIKKILAWITGKSDTVVAEAAPYKVETLPAGTEAAIVVGAGTETMVVIVPDAVAPAAVVPAAIETSTVTVKAKYKKADLNKMTKAQLMELVTKHSLEVKTRSTKEELVTVLAKV